MEGLASWIQPCLKPPWTFLSSQLINALPASAEEAGFPITLRERLT